MATMSTHLVPYIDQKPVKVDSQLHTLPSPLVSCLNAASWHSPQTAWWILGLPPVTSLVPSHTSSQSSSGLRYAPVNCYVALVSTVSLWMTCFASRQRYSVFVFRSFYYIVLGWLWKGSGIIISMKSLESLIWMWSLFGFFDLATV